ncbi:MAG: hypothetical protein IIC49_03725 [Planctomycetes bacterium]|nr:hypothetical protein [Planctomycetota bacterium]
MSSTEASTRLAGLLSRLTTAGELDPPPVPECGVEPLLYELLRSFLLWEASPAKAELAIESLLNAVVDCNELRICLPDEVHAMIGPRYPRGLERAMRIRSALNDLFEREHDASLEILTTLSKRDARAYLLSLEGVPPFVASRVVLLGLGAHAFPMDHRLLKPLIAEGVFAAEATPEAAAGWLERNLRAGEVRAAYLAIEAWAQKPAPKRSRRQTKSQPPAQRSNKAQD